VVAKGYPPYCVRIDYPGRMTGYPEVIPGQKSASGRLPLMSPKPVSGPLPCCGNSPWSMSVLRIFRQLRRCYFLTGTRANDDIEDCTSFEKMPAKISSSQEWRARDSDQPVEIVQSARIGRTVLLDLVTISHRLKGACEWRSNRIRRSQLPRSLTDLLAPDDQARQSRLALVWPSPEAARNR